MNIDNLKTTIAIMKRVQALEFETQSNLVNMKRWQTISLGDFYSKPLEFLGVKQNLHDLHACGNTACLAGHLALAPEFLKCGFSQKESGAPAFEKKDGAVVSAVDAIDEWFEFEAPGLAFYLIANDYIFYHKNTGRALGDIMSSKIIYGVDWENVTSKHIIDTLEQLLELGEHGFVQSVFLNLKKHCPEDYVISTRWERIIFLNYRVNRAKALLTPEF